MLKINDGGPAFPRTGYYPETNARHPEDLHVVLKTVTGCNAGMSLRDWFAAQALSGMLANSTCGPREDETVGQFRARIAVVSYAFADVLLVSRSLPHDAADPSPRRADRGPDADSQPPADATRGDQ